MWAFVYSICPRHKCVLACAFVWTNGDSVEKGARFGWIHTITQRLMGNQWVDRYGSVTAGGGRVGGIGFANGHFFIFMLSFSLRLSRRDSVSSFHQNTCTCSEWWTDPRSPELIVVCKNIRDEKLQCREQQHQLPVLGKWLQSFQTIGLSQSLKVHGHGHEIFWKRYNNIVCVKSPEQILGADFNTLIHHLSQTLHVYGILYISHITQMRSVEHVKLKKK